MHRRWLALLALAFVATLARTADAIEPEPRCHCPQRIVLPALGATNVPRNTKLWVLDHTGAPGSAATSLTSGPVLGEPLAYLAPHTEYNPNGTRFTTGADVDETPPVMPAKVTASIMVVSHPAEYMPIDAVTLWGDYDDDTALVKVDLWDGQRETTFYTTPQRTYLCAPGVSIRPGTIRVTIRAIDLAGNQSAPITTSVETTSSAGVTATTEDCGEGPRASGRHFRCGTGDLAVLFLIPIAAIGLLIGIVVVRLLRNARLRRTPPVDVGLLVAEAVVRTIMRRDLVASAVGLIATGVALTFEARGLGFVLGLFPLISLSSWGACRVALQRLHRIDAAAERRDTWLIVRDRSGESRIRANERVFRGAVRAALPAASVERD